MEGSVWFQSPKLYKENGFLEKKDALELIKKLGISDEGKITEEYQKSEVVKTEKKKEQKTRSYNN